MYYCRVHKIIPVYLTDAVVFPTKSRLLTNVCSNCFLLLYRRSPFDSSPPPPISEAKDRLLTSEIKELQAKLQALEMANYKLTQELAKVSGVDPSKIRGGRKV